MKPLQVWLPLFGGSLGISAVARDAQRAFVAWGRDATVWLMPGLEAPRAWRERGSALPVLAIPAEHLDRVDVFHVAETGEVLGPGSDARFPDGRVDRLLKAWLNVGERSPVKIYAAGRTAEDPDGALREAQDAAGPYVTEGHSTVELIHFLPAFGRGEAAVWGMAERFKLVEKTPAEAARRDLEAAYRSDAWRKTLTQLVPVRRAWGAIGLFWALLLEKLEDGRSFLSCASCGRIMQGKRGKRFCNADDDEECFRARRARQRTRERGR